MPIFTAVPDMINVGGFVPFQFTFEPLTLGSKLDDDVSLYFQLSNLCEGLHPTWPMLLFMGQKAEELFLRRGGTSNRWAAFTAEVSRRYPAITAATEVATAEVAALAVGDRKGAALIWRPSGLEVVFGHTLLNNLPDGVDILGDQPLPGSHAVNGGAYRCDFQYRCDALDQKGPRVEVLGFLDRFGQPRTAEGVRYAERQGTRKRIYEDAGLEQPIVVYADEICEPQLRMASAKRILAALGTLRCKALAA